MSFKRCKLSLHSKELQYELVAKLNNECNNLDSKYKINYGGCCYVAGCIARLLEETNLNFSLIVFDNKWDLRGIKCLEDLPEPMSHYAIVLDDEGYIGEGINCCEDDFDDSYQAFKASSIDIFDYYYNHQWNNVYDCFYNFKVKCALEKTYNEFIRDLLQRRPVFKSVS